MSEPPAAHARRATIEALELGPAPDPHRLGEGAPHTLLRLVRCIEGAVELEMEFRPRPGYGLVVPTFEIISGGAVATGGSATLTLSTTLPLAVDDGNVTARSRLEAGDVEALAMQFRDGGAEPAAPYRPSEITAAVDATTDAWRGWSDLHQTYRGPWQELVHHSGRVLQALSYQPTGAIIAAATTSLPEVVGGERNWDYRYAWVRDASFTMEALWVAACPHEAGEFFDFIATAGAAVLPERHLQIMFGIGGEIDLTERTLPHWTGWRASAPVRVGNGAWNQPQLDVYGELLDAATLLGGQLAPMPPALQSFLAVLADAAAAHWREPDHGIWEIRGEPRHYLFSKLMCWVALDRAIAMADQLDAEHASTSGGGPRSKSGTRSSTKAGTRASARSPRRSGRTTSMHRHSCSHSWDSSHQTTRGFAPRSMRSSPGSSTSEARTSLPHWSRGGPPRGS